MSSNMGKILHICPARQNEVMDPNLTIEQLSGIMDEFVRYLGLVLLLVQCLGTPAP